MTPRPYQLEAMDALDAYLASSDGNPCIVLPTGSGKTPCMAWTIQRYLQWPQTRICVLAHIRELLEQGVEKMRQVWPAAPIGVYSAGLGSHDIGYSVTYAGIQSIYNKACDFPPFDLVFIDEAHRVPLRDDGQYRQFLRDARLNNPGLRVVGWTATPYRLDGGKICGKDFILTDVAYEANVKALIDEGYLAPLRTKVGAHTVNVSGVNRTAGDFNRKQLEAAAQVPETVAGIAKELCEIIDRTNRRSVIVFACGVGHAEDMSRAISAMGVDMPTIHEGTSDADRRSRAEAFKRGKLRGLVNVNVLSEGFDAQRVDCVALIRPTESKGLYYQQVGRGLRVHESKQDCLVLDFAGNIVRHGPIDKLEGEVTRTMACPQCRERFAEVCGTCPDCGWVIPPPPPKEEISADRAPRLIPTDPRARTEANILSDGNPWEMLVDRVEISRHQKEGKPPTLCVRYVGPGGMESHREWICLEHPGYAGHKGRAWWKTRFGEPPPATVDEALARDLFLGRSIAKMTAAIKVKQAGRYTEVVGVRFAEQHVGAIAR